MPHNRSVLDPVLAYLRDRHGPVSVGKIAADTGLYPKSVANALGYQVQRFPDGPVQRVESGVYEWKVPDA